MTNRRDFLRNSALLTAGGLVGSSIITSCGSTAAPAAPAKKEIVGLQTYSVGQELSADVPGGLKKIAEMGYTELELAGYRDGKLGEYTMAEYRKLAEDAGLKITGSHLSPSIRQYTKENIPQFDEFWKKAVADHVELGVKTMVQPSMPAVASTDDAKVIGEIFNNAGKFAKDAGILWGYHNHSGEFARVMSEADKAEAERIQKERAAQMAQMQRAAAQGGQPAQQQQRAPMARAPQGEYIEKLFLDNTDPELVMFELDCYWAVMGQQDPCWWLKNYPNRYKLLHVKDKWIIGNSGMMNWEMIFKTGYEIGIVGWYVELENDGDDSTTQFYGIEQSAKYLLNAPFVK